MATKKRKTKRRHKGTHGLAGTSFNQNRISAKGLINEVGKPILAGLGGAAVGHFAGKGGNLIAAGVLGVASLGFNMPLLASAAVGAAVVTPAPATATNGIEGIDGVSDFLKGGLARTKGYAKAALTNVGLTSIAAKINGIEGIEDVDYLEGYANDVGDTEAMYGYLNESPEELNGYPDGRLIGSSATVKTPEAILLQG
ncbi:MAG: hypothetical protein U0Y10_17660 [Spirosomataceae bacterium]